MSKPIGTLTVHIGCIGSGKTTKLMRYARCSEIGGIPTLVLTPLINHDQPEIWSSLSERIWRPIPGSTVYIENYHINRARAVTTTRDGTEIKRLVIDSAHLLPLSMISRIILARDLGIEVVVAAVQRDFREQPFDMTRLLLSHADEVVTHFGVCYICGAERATCSQRVRDGKPDFTGPIIKTGGVGPNDYMPCCRSCFVFPPSQ